MDKKKIAIIALVFIFLGTMIFAFANPRDEELKDNSKPSEVDKDKTTDDDKQDEEDTEKERETEKLEEENNNTNTVVNTNNGNNTDVVVDYYKLALEAVEKAEASLVQNDVDSAKDLINNVTTDQKDDLLDRINDVQNIIDFDKLLKVLENKTNSSTNKNELNDARDFNTSNSIADKLESLKDSASKTEFEERYNVVLLTLNDVTNPVINGVTEGEYTNRELEIEVVEDTEYVITLDGEAYELGTSIGEGVHVLKVVDKAFNETVVNFTIDTTDPTITMFRVQNFYNTSGNQNYAKIGDRIAITIVTSEKINENPKILVGGKEFDVPVQEEQFNKYVVYVELTDDMILVDNEKIEVTIKELYDLAGNNSEEVTLTGDDNYYVILDSSKPVTNNIILKNLDSFNGNQNYANVGDRVWLYLIFNERLVGDPTVKINGQEVKRVQYENGDNWNQPWEKFVFEYIVPENAAEGAITFEVTNAIDKNGNVADVITEENVDKVYIDLSNPTFDNLVNNTEDYSVSLGVTDDSFDYILITNNDTGYQWKEERYWTSFSLEGNYSVQIFDKAGNSSDIYTFTIKQLAGIANVNGEEIKFSNYSELFNIIPDNTLVDIVVKKDSDENIVIPENKIISLNLNGNILKGSKAITNNGTIKELFNGTIITDNNGIINYGTIETLNNLTINSERTAINNKGLINEVRDLVIDARFYPIYLDNGTIKLLENNQVTGHYQSGIYLSGTSIIENIASGSYVTYGDKPDMGNSVSGFGLYISTDSVIKEISGGSFQGNQVAVANYGNIETISGGEFLEKIENNTWTMKWTFGYGGIISNITGGKFYSYNGELSGIFRYPSKQNSIAEGYRYEGPNNEGYFTVVAE